MTEHLIEVSVALDSLVPPFDGSQADWQDALRRGGAANRRPFMASLAAALIVAAVLGATAFGQGFASNALDRVTAWIDHLSGNTPSEIEQNALREANARSAAPIPEDTALGLLVSSRLDGVRFDLLGFRDRASLCLRLRSSIGEGTPITKAPAACVAEQLLVDLGEPLAVVAAADPFPRKSKPGLQALYGLAADGVASVKLINEAGAHRVSVENNAFLYLYRGEPPSLPRDRLVYRSDVPHRAIALDANGKALGGVEIMSLKRGYPGTPEANKLPGPSVVEHPINAPRVGWLDRGEERGVAYEWPQARGGSGEFPRMRMIQPSSATSLRVLVGRVDRFPSRPGAAYCLTNVWPLSPGPRGFMCDPIGGRSGSITLASATTVFDAQFPVFYGLVPDDVHSLILILENGATEPVPIVDNVFAFQTSGAEAAKLVGYDAEGRVALIRVVGLG